MSVPTAAAAPQQATVRTHRSLDAIANDVWSPSELHVLDPNCDVLSPSLPALAVPFTRVYTARLSLIAAPFETLHTKWKPDARTGGAGSGGASALANATYASAKVTWSTRDAHGSECVIAEQCKKSFWLRFTTTVETRSFIVERSPAHLATFVSAIQYTFPQLFVPIQSEPTATLAALLCEFSKRNEEQLSCYLPALYFFFETQERVAIMFFSTLESELRGRRSSEFALFDSLRPKVSKGWFSWGSSSKLKVEHAAAAGGVADGGDSLSETIKFIDSQLGTIPPCVKPAYLSAVSRGEQFTKLVAMAHELKRAFNESAEALMGVATGVSVSPQTNEPVQGWYLTDEQDLVADAKADAADMKRTAGVLQQMVFGAANIKKEVGHTVLSAIVEVTEKAAVVAASRQQYLELYLSMKRVTAESAPFVSGKVPLVKGCPAASNPGQLQQVTALYQTQSARLSSWEKQLEEEVEFAITALRSLERQICTFVFTALSSQLEGYDERHHTQLVTTFAAPGRPETQTLRDLFQSARPGRPDDIVGM